MKNNNGFVFVNLMPFREQIKKEQMKQIYKACFIIVKIKKSTFLFRINK